MTMKRVLASYVTAAVAAVGLTGCNLQQTAPISVGGAALQGKVYGGQQPIGSSTIQLYAAGNTGYGSSYNGGASLLTTAQSTGNDGSFSIAGDYTCPSATTPVYIVALGGTPSPPSGAVNSQIALMAALGPCGAAGQNHPHIVLNEVSTVASVYALAPFMTGITNIGSTSTNSTGLANAFATVNKLVNLATGSAGGPALPATAVLPTAKINTIADAIAACVNSSGGTAGSGGACGSLFTDTTVNGTAPTNTILAVMNLAQNPTSPTTPLTSLVLPNAPFQPTLSAAPHDYSLVLTYSGGGIATPKGIAADTAGNVWTANSGSNTASKIDALGVTSTDTAGFLSGSTGYSLGALSAPSAIAIDLNGNAWLTNAGNSTVTEINAAGTTGTVFTGGNMSLPASVAVDASSNVWVANKGNGSVTQISAGGTFTNFTAAGVSAPVAVAINAK